MITDKNRRKKRRRANTYTPRFGPDSVALEIGLIRQSLDVKTDCDLCVSGNQRRLKY